GALRAAAGLAQEVRCLHCLPVRCKRPAANDVYTLSLHDALPISDCGDPGAAGRNLLDGRELPPKAIGRLRAGQRLRIETPGGGGDRKSTRLNSSHASISYAGFCLKKKKDKTSAGVQLAQITDVTA